MGQSIYVKCNLCHRDKIHPLIKIDGFSWVRCQHCGLIYLNPRPKSAKELNPAVMETGVDYFTRKGYSPDKQNYYKRYIKKFEGYRKTNRLLKIGCASGGFLYAARDCGWQAKGIEYFEPAARYGRDRYKLNIITGSLLKIKLPKEYFDLVIMNMVIEHLENPIGTLFRINQFLRLKGAVYIHTPNYDSLSLKLFPHYPKFCPRDHFYFFIVRTLERALTKTGFQIVWKKTRGFEFPTGKGRTPSLKRQSLRLIKNMVFPVVNVLGKGDRVRVLAEKRVVS